MHINYWKLRHFCESPVRPDPVWKPSRGGSKKHPGGYPVLPSSRSPAGAPSRRRWACAFLVRSI